MIKAYRRTSFRYDFIRENHEKEINFSFKFVSQEGKDKKKPHFKGLNLHFEFFNIIFYTTQKPPYSYEVELKDGSIEESFDCYEKDEKKICEIDLEKKVVVNYWKIEK